MSTTEGAHESVLEIWDSLLGGLNVGSNVVVLEVLLLLFSHVVQVRVEEAVEVIKECRISVVNGRDSLLNWVRFAAHVGGPGISEDGNSHANVARGDGSDSSNEEGDSSVGEVGGALDLPDLSGINSEADDQSKHAAEEGEVNVFSSQELFSTLCDETIDLDKFLGDLFSLSLISDFLVLDVGTFLISKHFFDGFKVFEVDLVHDEEVNQSPSNGGD